MRRGVAVWVVCGWLASIGAGCASRSPGPSRGRGFDAESDFLWPVASGRLSSAFGPRGSSRHEGIDIAAPIGTPVRAARSGRVTFSGMARGYGNTVIVQHAGGVSTRYAHNKQNLVRRGDLVHRGQVIAKLGVTGRTDGPHLHFEIRERRIATDPLVFFPEAPRADHLVGR